MLIAPLCRVVMYQISMEHYCLHYHLKAALKTCMQSVMKVRSMGFFSQVSNIILMGLISVHY